MRIRVSFLFAVVFIYGCGPAIQVGPKNLDFAQPRIVNVCVTTAAPPPFAETITIRIAPGEEVYADAGGETLLRQYAALRDAIRKGQLMQCPRQ